jgi:hypothetical protein
MWTLPRSDLKVRLTLRIVAVSALCLAATSAYVLYDADRSARARIEAIAEITAKDLELQQSKMDWVKGQPVVFPDLQNIATAVMAPGLCIAYREDGGDILQRFCGGTEDADANPPTVFAALYRGLFDPGREAVRSVLFRDKKVGEAVAWVDPATLTAQAWHDASRLLAVMLITLLLLCGLVYAALARASPDAVDPRRSRTHRGERSFDPLAAFRPRGAFGCSRRVQPPRRKPREDSRRAQRADAPADRPARRRAPAPCPRAS